MMSSNSIRILSLLIVTAFVMNCVNYFYCTLYYRDMSKPVSIVTELTDDDLLQKLRTQHTGLLGKIFDRPETLMSSQSGTASSQSSSSDYDTTTDAFTTFTTLSIGTIRTMVHFKEPSETSEVKSALGSPPGSKIKM